jgi:hypothetical protein
MIKVTCYSMFANDNRSTEWRNDAAVRIKIYFMEPVFYKVLVPNGDEVGTFL